MQKWRRVVAFWRSMVGYGLQPCEGRMVILLLSYLLRHGLALMLLPEQAELVSFVFLISAPLLA